MRISTAQMAAQGVRSMVENQARLARTQQQLASGERIQRPSDDPIAAARLLDLGRQIAGTEQLGKNIGLATARLELEDSTLGATGDILQRARELAVQGNNSGALNDADRRSIAAEVRQLRAQMIDMANTVDGIGEYLFAGYASRTQPFSDAAGVVSYAGDNGVRDVQIGPSRTLAISDAGQGVFMDIDDGAGGTQDVFLSLERLAVALETPGQTLSADIEQLDRAMEHMSALRGRVGARLNTLDQQDQANRDFLLRLQTLQHDLGAVDYAEAATRLSSEALALQAAQQSYSKVQGLSLFRFL